MCSFWRRKNDAVENAEVTWVFFSVFSSATSSHRSLQLACSANVWEFHTRRERGACKQSSCVHAGMFACVRHRRLLTSAATSRGAEQPAWHGVNYNLSRSKIKHFQKLDNEEQCEYFKSAKYKSCSCKISHHGFWWCAWAMIDSWWLNSDAGLYFSGSLVEPVASPWGLRQRRN